MVDITLFTKPTETKIQRWLKKVTRAIQKNEIHYAHVVEFPEEPRPDLVYAEVLAPTFYCRLALEKPNRCIRILESITWMNEIDSRKLIRSCDMKQIGVNITLRVYEYQSLYKDVEKLLQCIQKRGKVSKTFTAGSA